MKGLLRRPPSTRLQGAHFFEITRLHVIRTRVFFTGGVNSTRLYCEKVLFSRENCLGMLFA